MKEFIWDYHAGDVDSWIILDKEVWKRFVYEDHVILQTDGMHIYKRVLHPLHKKVEDQKKYMFDIKFKAKTNAQNIRLMLSDKSDYTGNAFVVWTGRVPDDRWMRVKGKFITDCKNLSFFMIASTDFKGCDSNICFEWVQIWEEGITNEE